MANFLKLLQFLTTERQFALWNVADGDTMTTKHRVTWFTKTLSKCHIATCQRRMLRDMGRNMGKNKHIHCPANNLCICHHDGAHPEKSCILEAGGFPYDGIDVDAHECGLQIAPTRCTLFQGSLTHQWVIQDLHYHHPNHLFHILLPTVLEMYVCVHSCQGSLQFIRRH